MASCAAGCVAPRPRGSGRARGGAPASAALPLHLSSAPVTSAGSARPPRVSLVPFVRASLPTGQKRTRSEGDFPPVSASRVIRFLAPGNVEMGRCLPRGEGGPPAGPRSRLSVKSYGETRLRVAPSCGDCSAGGGGGCPSGPLRTGQQAAPAIGGVRSEGGQEGVKNPKTLTNSRNRCFTQKSPLWSLGTWGHSGNRVGTSCCLRAPQ